MEDNKHTYGFMGVVIRWSFGVAVVAKMKANGGGL